MTERVTDYDSIASQFDAYDADAITDVEIGYASVVRLLGGCKGRQILDYGCGTGKMSRYLAARGARVTGVDVSRREIEIAKARRNGINYHHIKSAKLGMVLPGQDDVVISFVLCTIPSKDEIVRVLDACRYTLRANGRVIVLNGNMEASHGREFVSFSIPHLDNPKSGDRVTIRLGRDRKIEVSDFYWTQADYIEMFNRAGLVMTKVLEPCVADCKADGSWRDEWDHPPFKLYSAFKP